MKQRIITGILAGAGFIGLLTAGGVWFQILICLLAILGYFEFLRMFGLKRLDWVAVIALIGMLYCVLPWGHLVGDYKLPWLTVFWAFLVMLLAATVLSKNRVSIESVSIMFLGALYIGLGFHYMIVIRNFEDGLFWALLLFVCIWLSDSGAYFTGKAWGKTPLWPAISPNKTIEGSIGGVILAVAAALAFHFVSPELLNLRQAIAIGLCAAIGGQLGDLMQSAYKRARGVKDSGAILPGHGGVLDRCDSWLIVFPLVKLLLLVP